MTAHAFHDYNVAFNFCRFRALAYTTLDNLRAVFFYLIFAVLLMSLLQSTFQSSFEYLQLLMRLGIPRA